jgi:anti-anti-sigma factor
MEITAEEAGPAIVLHVAGQLDTRTAPELETKVDALLAEGDKSLIFDLSRTVYVSSAGLRVMLSAAKRMLGANQRFALCGVNADVMEVLTMTGFHRILPIHDDVEHTLAGWES